MNNDLEAGKRQRGTVCSLPLKRGGVGRGSQGRFAARMTPSLSLPLSGGGNAAAMPVVHVQFGARGIREIAACTV